MYYDHSTNSNEIICGFTLFIPKAKVLFDWWIISHYIFIIWFIMRWLDHCLRFLGNPHWMGERCCQFVRHRKTWLADISRKYLRIFFVIRVICCIGWFNNNKIGLLITDLNLIPLDPTMFRLRYNYIQILLGSSTTKLDSNIQAILKFYMPYTYLKITIYEFSLAQSC